MNANKGLWKQTLRHYFANKQISAPYCMQLPALGVLFVLNVIPALLNAERQ